MSRTRVLIVDDSPLLRRLLSDMLSRDPELEVIGAASDAMRAWELIQRKRPDVITLDIQMPGMDGLTFLEKLMRAHPMPVVMVSALTGAGSGATLRALELGAIDFVAKPTLDIERGLSEMCAELLRKVKVAARTRPRPAGAPSSPLLGPAARALPAGQSVASVIVLGASTGGTEAVRHVLGQLPAGAPAVVVVQHMPEHFTRQFAERLDRLCAIRVREAADGDRVTAGLALIAPGGAAHTQIQLRGGHPIVRLVPGPPVNYSRPSVDVLFRSCADALGRKAVGALLTGMGHDGAEGLLAMRRAGAGTVAQDEASCVVFGMPKEAIARGGAELVAPLNEIGETLLRLARRSAALVP